MKKILFILFTILMASFGYSVTDSTHVKTKVNAVTVYPEGAQITREISVYSKLGKSVLIFDDLPFDITKENLQLGCNKLNHILSLKLEKVYGSSQKKSKEILRLEAKIEDIKLNSKRLSNKQEILDEEIVLLKSNNQLNSNSKTIPLTELKQTVEYFNSKMEASINKQLEIELQKEKLKDEVKEINKKLQALYNLRKKNSSKLVVLIDNKTPHKTDYTLSYYHKYAGWIPHYDFRIEQIDKPLTADYNATVFQSTGEDWKDVKLTLATIEPILNEPVKELKPWVLENKNASHKKAAPTIKPDLSSNTPSIRGTIKDESTGETIPMANVVVKRGQTIVQGGTTDFDGNYVISPISPGTYNIEISYIGYSTLNLTGITVSPSQSTRLNAMLKEDHTLLGEVTIEATAYEAPMIDPDRSGNIINRDKIMGVHSGGTMIRGGRSNQNISYSTKTPPANINSIVDGILKELKHEISNPEFKIDVPFTILADSKETDVRIKSIKIPTDYRYTIVPKIQQYAFLKAQIPNWTSYNFLSGNTKIFLKGKFIGQTYLDTDHFSDTLDLQLGKDPDILVKRTHIQQQSRKTVNGSKVKEVIAYNILVKNNKTTPFQIFIEDQIPITYRKDITIELLEGNGAKMDKGKGQLTWDLFLKPGEKKEINFSYLAKYPRY